MATLVRVAAAGPQHQRASLPANHLGTGCMRLGTWGAAQTLRYRDAKGVHRLPPLPEGATVGALVQALAEATGLPAGSFSCKAGFPPAPLSLANGSATLGSLGLKNGDTVVVEPGASGGAQPPPPAVAPAPPASALGGVVVRRAIADDNSCLFNAVGCVQAALLVERSRR